MVSKVSRATDQSFSAPGLIYYDSVEATTIRTQGETVEQEIKTKHGATDLTLVSFSFVVPAFKNQVHHYILDIINQLDIKGGI